MKQSLALAMFAVFALSGCDAPWSDTVTVYSARCNNDVRILPPGVRLAPDISEHVRKYRNSFDRCEIVRTARTTYRINFARAEVYYSLLGGPSRLINCAIMDRNNWSCSYPDGSGKVVLMDGLEAIGEHDIEWAARYKQGPTFYLHRWQWWTVAILDMLGQHPVRSSLLIPEQKWHSG